MSLKFTLLATIAVSLTVAGCCSGGSCWSKPGYQAAPAAGSASRTYTPTETVSPYQQGPICLLYTSPSPRDGLLSRMPSSA